MSCMSKVRWKFLNQTDLTNLNFEPFNGQHLQMQGNFKIVNCFIMVKQQHSGVTIKHPFGLFFGVC